ncbi:hypothetical protein [Azospirillum sp. TSO5]|uniref:hypothetical protein n=1 Tax=Azospirillum sp. TSO5 TaxID=716760 RepID=UPI000D64BE86|nr:hypothetical protein [Azospirillum sp. TSO5]
MRSVVRGVAGMPYPAGRSGWAAEDAATAGTAGRSRRGTLGLLPAVVGPLLAVSVLGALILHLLAGLVARLPASDALGALSVMVGMAVVLVTLLPFALLSVRRAQRAWAAMQESVRR